MLTAKCLHKFSFKATSLKPAFVFIKLLSGGLSLNTRITELINRYPLLEDCAVDIELAYSLMHECYLAGGKVLICGNGGSAADAEHWSGELMKSFLKDRPLPAELQQKLGTELSKNLQLALPTIPLTGYISLSTAFANDVKPDMLFAQMVLGLGKTGDILIGISTSGESMNILHALQTASALEMKTIGLTGEKGGRMSKKVDVCIRVPATEVHQVQEYHLPIYHCISMMLEDTFFPEKVD